MSNLYIMHYGVGHNKGGHSGRYPWGSGENPYGGKKRLKSTRHMVAAANYRNEADRLDENYRSSSLTKELGIYNIIEGELKNSKFIKNQPEPVSVSDMMDKFVFEADDKTRKDFINDVIKKSPKLRRVLNDYRLENRQYSVEAQQYIEKIGRDFSLPKLYKRGLLDSGNIGRIQNFIKTYYANKNYLDGNKSDAEIVDDILLTFLT